MLSSREADLLCHDQRQTGIRLASKCADRPRLCQRHEFALQALELPWSVDAGILRPKYTSSGAWTCSGSHCQNLPDIREVTHARDNSAPALLLARVGRSLERTSLVNGQLAIRWVGIESSCACMAQQRIRSHGFAEPVPRSGTREQGCSAVDPALISASRWRQGMVCSLMGADVRFKTGVASSCALVDAVHRGHMCGRRILGVVYL